MTNKKGHQKGSPSNNFTSNTSLSLTECIAAFTDDMRSNGIKYPPTQIIADGELHIFSPIGKKGDTAGRYVFHGDGIPSGYYQDFRQGLKVRWSAGKDSAPKMAPAELASYRRRIAKQKAEARRQLAEQYQQAATKARERFKKSVPARSSHAYLVKKGVQPHNARLLGDSLLIPLHDNSGRHQTDQIITPTGRKMLLKGGKKKGAFCVIGAKLHELDGAEYLYMVEGWATGASVAESFPDVPVIVAIDSGNLRPVTEVIKKRWPYLSILIFADNDRKAESEGLKNVGVESARAVANQFLNVAVEVPNFPDSAPLELSDFNDLVQWRKSQTGGDV